MTSLFITKRGSPKWRRRHSFSLVELLVTIVILSIIILMMLALSNQASRAWLMGLGQNERRSNGRLLLEFVARDLKTAVLPTKSLTSSSSTNAPADLQFFANISTAPNLVSNSTNNPTCIATTDLNPHACFWQAPVAADTTYGNIAEIGYFVRWDTTSKPGTAIAQMCRFRVDPAAIDPTSGNTASGSNFLIYNRSGGNPVNWLSVVDAVAPANAASNYQGWFADNVIAFWVRCLDSSGQPIMTNAAGIPFSPAYNAATGVDTYGFDSRQGYTDSTGIIHPPPALPAAIDLAIVTVNSETAARITTPLTAIVTTPADMLKDKSTIGSIDYFINHLPANVQPGTQLFYTTVYIPTK